MNYRVARNSISLGGAVMASMLMMNVAAAQEQNYAALAGQPPVRVIFDCDMDSDCDDAGALGILNALADNGEVEILAVTVSALHPYSGPAADAINTYYGRPNVPIGVARPPAPNQKSRYAQGVAESAPYDLPVGQDAPDAVNVYRDVLTKADDGSVTIVTVGDMTNLARLVASPADLELVRRKVKLWACMGGNFIGKPAKDDLKLTNNNFTLDAKATYSAITNWPTPIVFAGREVCSVPSGLQAGASLKQAPKDHPVRIAYQLYFGGDVKSRHVADLATVVYAVRGLRDYWDAESTGSMDLQKDMTFTWRYDLPPRPQAYLLKKRDAEGKTNDKAIEKIIDELLVQPPKSRK